MIEIVTAAQKLGAQLTSDYEGKIYFVGILQGSIPFSRTDKAC